MTQITVDEYRERMERLGDAVKSAGLDLFLVSSFDSIYYLTGAGFEPLERPFFLLVGPGRDRKPELIVPRLDERHMRKASHLVGTIHTYREYPAPEGRRWIDELLQRIGPARRIGIEPSLARGLSDEIADREVIAVPLVEQLRAVKTPAEIAMIRRAARYADLAVGRLLDASYRGATAAACYARTGGLTKTIIREQNPFEPLTTRVLMATWPAPRSAQPHSVPDLNDRLGPGAHVALAFLRVNGYAAECERTYFTVPPDAESRGVFRAMNEARHLVFRSIRPGLSCGELDAMVSEFLRARGFEGEDCRLHRLGHGIGLGNHEAPWLAEGSEDELGENMVVSVEPGIYVSPGSSPGGGFRHSDTVLVTADGCERLTRFTDDLDELIVRGWRPLARLNSAMVSGALDLRGKRPQP
ncbi:M24 family metallopeptidase [Tautonia marina]|uniref:M24 family metallopeptidase n=1 Tax=Tautonia marina TaxID=2653855 RepID=UPI001260FE98|nr:Xaa-Pro peptidase family protein [Tautonia marina]